MSASSSPKRRIGGVFNKKTDKRDGEKAAPEKKKKHKRQPSIASTKVWRIENGQVLSEIDGAQSLPSKKEKAKSLRVRFQGGKAKPLKKKKKTENKQGISLEEPAPHSNEKEQSELEGNDEEDNEQTAHPVEDEESWVVLTASVVPQDFVPKFPAETNEIESSVPDPTCLTQDDSTEKTIIPKPEGPPEGLKGQEDVFPSTAILWEAFVHLKQVLLNNDKIADDVSSSPLYQIRLYGVSLAKLGALWSFLLTRASQASKQILVYWVSSLIKKYPQCFKVQLKEKKQRRKKRRTRTDSS